MPIKSNKCRGTCTTLSLLLVTLLCCFFSSLFLTTFKFCERSMAPKCYPKTLTSTDINHKLMVPRDLLGNLFPDPNPDSEPIPLSFKDEWGKDYTFYLKVRSRKTGQIRYDKKPEFMFKEWRAFVVEKKLKVGERFFLWWDDRGSLRIRAHHRPPCTKLFGTTFLH